MTQTSSTQAHGLAPRDGLEQRLQGWLRDEAGLTGERRLVRLTTSRAVVSKVAPGFVERLEDAIAAVPELFEAAAHAKWSREAAQPGLTRPEAWRRGFETGLREYERRGQLSADQRAEVMAGVDSVAAILETVTWTAQPPGAPWTPSDGEQDAFLETLRQLQPGAPIYTREFGTFEGRRVMNHCPGGRHALRLFTLGWETCLEAAPPETAARAASANA